MAHWEATGKSDEWLTPRWVFDALDCRFDVDVAAHPTAGHVPCNYRITRGSLDARWHGFVWMNPPFGGRNGLEPWLQRFIEHGDGIGLTPDRTSAPWFRTWAPRAACMRFLPKVRFVRPDGTEGKSPSVGTALWAAGNRAAGVLRQARGLGVLVTFEQEAA
jgi:hypothetical protein